MSRIPQEEIDRIKREVDLVALVRSKGIELKKHGSTGLVGLCPFHDDKKTPNFIITPHKNLWHCPPCAKGGSVIDFVMKYAGVSFLHAFEILKEANPQILINSSSPVKKSTVPKLSSPFDFTADDETVLKQVFDFYHERLFENQEALEYLYKRGLSNETIKTFKIGFADRTLGLRLPYSCNKEGMQSREKLKRLGILRPGTGHEHFNGCVVFPIIHTNGSVQEAYGRKVGKQKNKIYHLYLPGRHVGIWNPDCLKSSVPTEGTTAERSIILTESIIDAATFWSNGFKNITSIYGTSGFTDELFEALIASKTKTIRFAYDNDKAGNQAAERDAIRLQSVGIECFRIKFPPGMDANEYARKVTPANKSLQLLIQSAQWLGKGADEAQQRGDGEARNKVEGVPRQSRHLPLDWVPSGQDNEQWLGSKTRTLKNGSSKTGEMRSETGGAVSQIKVNGSNIEAQVTASNNSTLNNNLAANAGEVAKDEVRQHGDECAAGDARRVRKAGRPLGGLTEQIKAAKE